jgi:hypothetical protein
MPGANKYSVATTNRFALDSAGESSGSEDEGINQDPFAMIKQAEIDAVKNAKNAVKAKALADKEAKAAAAKAAKAAITGDKKVEGEKKTDRRNDRPRRTGDARGNQQARSGKRFEKTDGEAKDGENAENKLSERDGNRPVRTNDRRRGNDRKSGDPRTGYRSGAQGEKRQGGGKFNTGKSTENPDDAEKATPEAVVEDVENKDPEVVEEEAEPVEPETPELTLEEYMAQLSAPTEAAKASRKANDGENVLKGNVIQSVKVHQDPHNAKKFGGIEKNENKVVIDSKDLGFKSGTNQRGGERNYYADGESNDRRGDRDGGDRRGGRGGRGGRGAGRGGQRGGDSRAPAQKSTFSMEAMNDEAFPTLGGKK